LSKSRGIQKKYSVTYAEDEQKVNIKEYSYRIFVVLIALVFINLLFYNYGFRDLVMRGLNIAIIFIDAIGTLLILIWGWVIFRTKVR